MRAEERAEAAVCMMERYDARLHGRLGDYGLSIIASAIRETEASARNEALEEAAVMFETEGDLFEAAAIRNLKTKD